MNSSRNEQMKSDDYLQSDFKMGDILKTGFLSYSQKKVIKSSWSRKFFALISKTQRGICLVGFQNEDKFSRFEAAKLTRDASRFDKCIKDHAQVVISNIQCLNAVLLKGQDAMETMTDSGKKYTLLADREGSNHVDSWVKTFVFALSQNVSHGSGLGSQHAQDRWSSSQTSIDQENDLYESAHQGPLFQVLVLETDATSRINLYGNYDLQINSRNITLVDQATKQQRCVWPFKFLRRYGRTSNEFSFEAGRRSESGEGVFKFRTPAGNEIFDEVERMAVAIRTSERQSSSSGSFRGRSPPPVSCLPRPSSLGRKLTEKQSQSFDVSTGIDSTHKDSNSSVYAEPIKVKGRPGSVKKKEGLSRKLSAPQLDSAYCLAVESSSPPGQNNNNIDCTYSMVGQKAPMAPPEQAHVVGATYENVDTRPAPPVPPKLMDSPNAAASRGSVMSVNAKFTKLKVEKIEPPDVDDADYADPDDLGESEYAYACAEDIKRDLSWMKKPEPGAIKFQIEPTDDSVDYEF